MFFRLNPECVYIKGDLNGAIYDLIDGDVYALNTQESRIIEACENNEEIDSSDPFLHMLKQRIIGNFYEKKVYIEKLRLGSPIEDFQPGIPPVLTRAFLEIANDCDNSCWYCGYYGISRSMGCLGCNVWNEEGKTVETDRWKEVIDELYRLHCFSLFIKGGNLSKNWEKTREILEYAKKQFKKVFIICHKSHFSQDMFDYLEKNVHLVIQINTLSDSEDRNINLLITDYQESHQVTANLPGNVFIDIVSQNYYEKNQASPLNSKKKINKTNLEKFTHNNKLHPCLGNTIAITWKGDVLPCPMMRNHVLGNIGDTKIWTFLRGTPDCIQEFWKMDMSSLEKCGMCEFRYACSDCRALEENQTGNLHTKVLCDYDPTKGTWQQQDA